MISMTDLGPRKVCLCVYIRKQILIWHVSEHRLSTTKETKKETKEKNNKTHKQTSDQTNKQTNKQIKKTKKQTSNVVCFFGLSDALVGAIACWQTKKIKRQQPSNHADRQKENKKKQKKQISNVACFFWPDAIVETIACGQAKEIKRQPASNHAGQHKLIDFTYRNRPVPQIPKAILRFVEVVVWFGRPQRGGCVFIKSPDDKTTVDLAISEIYGGSGRAGRPYMFMATDGYIIGKTHGRMVVCMNA